MQLLSQVLHLPLPAEDGELFKSFPLPNLPPVCSQPQIHLCDLLSKTFLLKASDGWIQFPMTYLLLEVKPCLAYSIL